MMHECYVFRFSGYFLEIFVDDFSVFGSSLNLCLANLAKVLQMYMENELVLNWENCISWWRRK